MNRYLVVFEKTNSGYSAYVPDLPGCVATADTRLKTEKMIYESIQLHLENMKKEDIKIPRGQSESEVLVFN